MHSTQAVACRLSLPPGPRAFYWVARTGSRARKRRVQTGRRLLGPLCPSPALPHHGPRPLASSALPARSAFLAWAPPLVSATDLFRFAREAPFSRMASQFQGPPKGALPPAEHSGAPLGEGVLRPGSPALCATPQLGATLGRRAGAGQLRHAGSFPSARRHRCSVCRSSRTPFFRRARNGAARRAAYCPSPRATNRGKAGSRHFLPAGAATPVHPVWLAALGGPGSRLPREHTSLPPILAHASPMPQSRAPGPGSASGLLHPARAGTAPPTPHPRKGWQPSCNEARPSPCPLASQRDPSSPCAATRRLPAFAHCCRVLVPRALRRPRSLTTLGIVSRAWPKPPLASRYTVLGPEAALADATLGTDKEAGSRFGAPSPGASQAGMLPHGAKGNAGAHYSAVSLCQGKPGPLKP